MNPDQDVRTMLRARAEEVTAAPVIPLSTLRRVRVRKTLMTGSVAAVVAALVFGGFAASRSLSNDAAPNPPAGDFPTLTTTFVSPRNGFSINHPDGAVLTPATQIWGINEQPDDGFDVMETGRAVVFKGASTGTPHMENGVVAGVDIPFDEWVDDYVSPGGCGEPRSQQAEITIDGQPGRISECPNEIEATVVYGGRVYLFMLVHDRTDARAVFDAFAATIDLTPETAVNFPALTSTFVSPTYGYTFGYLDRGKGTITPATELWDPVNQPPIDDAKLDDSLASHSDEFDVVETGFAAVFQSASTKIPDGVSIDEWVDAAVGKYLPAYCYVPRSRQTEITIGGQPGRILDHCPGKHVATVVTDGRLYLFILHREDPDGRAYFDDWATTIDLTPETAAVP